jgi:hypothetical protein
MSALGQKHTSPAYLAMSALPFKADIANSLAQPLLIAGRKQLPAPLARLSGPHSRDHAYSLRQLLANATIASSRVSA